MEFLEKLGEPADNIVSILLLLGFIWAGIKYIPKWYRWLISWTFVRREELNRLREMEPKYRECDAELKRLKALYAPYIKQREEILEQRYGKRE